MGRGGGGNKVVRRVNMAMADLEGRSHLTPIRDHFSSLSHNFGRKIGLAPRPDDNAFMLHNGRNILQSGGSRISRWGRLPPIRALFGENICKNVRISSGWSTFKLQ